MQGITLLPANLITVVLESFLSGLLCLLFASTIYFFTTRRTLAGERPKHHLLSYVFVGVTTLFVVAIVHWTIVIYQAFFAFVHLGEAKSEDKFYADLSQPSEIAKAILISIAVVLGDALVTYRLWIIWGQTRKIAIFPLLALLLLFACFLVVDIKMSNWNPNSRGTTWDKDSGPWMTTAFVVSLLANLYNTGFIIFRILRASKTTPAGQSTLVWFLSILIESATLQTSWLLFTGIVEVLKSDLTCVTLDNFPAILAVSNTLIHARIGLGWSKEPAVAERKGYLAENSV
ncbi:hypothetical protein R3P38DRAFT_2508864 [Favolaschia claudopus]|uniref:Uncharacterized protein n=1 Tax=Favolaschia claudopus TaxID=2862362 RepID=A0AAW0D357_9AGAR